MPGRCAGIFSAACALELYAEVFDEKGALDHFEAFASLNGPAFYRLPVNETRVTLRREPTLDQCPSCFRIIYYKPPASASQASAGAKA